MHKNLDTGMTRDRYFDMCEQMGNEPLEDEIPPDWDDFPDIVTIAANTFSQLGDRIQGDIGYIGKDYTNFKFLLHRYGIEEHNEEYVLETILWLDSRAIEASQKRLKAERDKIKRR